MNNATGKNNLQVVYLLDHVRETEMGNEDIKCIGIYTSKSHAESAIDRLRNQPGFKENLDGFSIDEYELNKDHWVEGFGMGE